MVKKKKKPYKTGTLGKDEEQLRHKLAKQDQPEAPNETDWRWAAWEDDIDVEVEWKSGTETTPST